MKTLLIILCIVLVVAFWPYVIAFPFAIVKALWLVLTGRDNDPEVVEMKEAKMRELVAKKEARKERRKAFWLPSSFR